MGEYSCCRLDPHRRIAGVNHMAIASINLNNTDNTVQTVQPYNCTIIKRNAQCTPEIAAVSKEPGGLALQQHSLFPCSTKKLLQSEGTYNL